MPPLENLKTLKSNSLLLSLSQTNLTNVSLSTKKNYGYVW